VPTITADNIMYVDLGDDPDFSISNIVSVKPEGLEWGEEVRNAGDISFQLSYSAEDQDNNTIASYGRDFIAPYRSYWRLRFGNIAICAGWITVTSSKLGSDFMSITGKTWEDVPGRWEYPFDGRTSPDHTQDFQFSKSLINDEAVPGTLGVPLAGSGLAYEAFQRDVINIFSDIFETVMNDVPYRITFDLSKLTTLSGIKTNYQLSLADNQKIGSLISDLGGTGDGFDWWISTARKIYWASPYRFGNPSAPSIIYTITDADLETGFLFDSDFTNNGPIATHVQGRGAGSATQSTLVRSYGYGPAQTQFSRFDESYDFGDVRNVNQLIRKTQRQLALGLNPVHEVPISLDPRSYSGNYWSTFRIGRAIWATLDYGYHLLDSAQRLKSYRGKMSSTGDIQVDWTLEQIYPQSTNVGTAEG